MPNRTSPTRTPRRIWIQLPPSARRRLVAQLVLLLRPTEVETTSEPIRHPAGPPQPPRDRVRAPIDANAGGAPSGESPAAVSVGRPSQSVRLARATLPDHRRRSGHLGRAEQQSSGLPATGLNGRAA